MSEPALMGLYDLLGKLANQPTIELWGLHKREPVPGLFCILENDVKKALVQAAIAQDQKLTSHVKLKLFGINEIDLPLIKSLRKFFGQSTFLTADANRGYKNWKSIDELAAIMNDLHVAGLDAMEDPAILSTQQWIELQSKVGDLALIPDYPMRPAYKALQSFSPEMGRYFNIHPDTMGTFTDVIELGKKIKNSNRGLMIGDSSFVGPACTFWQQLAIGLGASWVEALEKPQESNVFQQCVKQQSTSLTSEGKVVISTLYPGFGIEMDEAKLITLSNKVVQIF
jgi:L-alanine-DL-glutamate epimerase-like enolase superfamily enzyme